MDDLLDPLGDRVMKNVPPIARFPLKRESLDFLVNHFGSMDKLKDIQLYSFALYSFSSIIINLFFWRNSITPITKSDFGLIFTAFSFGLTTKGLLKSSLISV